MRSYPAELAGISRWGAGSWPVSPCSGAGGYNWATALRLMSLLVDLKCRGYHNGMTDYEPNLHIVLYQPEIPPNTGAVGRTCVALGMKLWLVRPLGFRVDEKTLRRAGMDYWQHLSWAVVDNWDALQQQLPVARFWLFSKKGERAYTEVRFQRGDVLVFGSETNGLPASFLAENPEKSVRIPIRPDVRSLNLSSSVAVAGYEAIRQIYNGDFSWCH